MRFTLVAAFAALLTFLSTTNAAAQVNGSREELVFVASTNLTDNAGDKLALCHLVKHQVILFVPVFTSMKSYALAENACDTDSFYEFTEASFIAEQTAGLIPTDLPVVPKLATGTLVKNYIVGGLGAIIALVLVLTFIRRKYREVMG